MESKDPDKIEKYHSVTRKRRYNIRGFGCRAAIARCMLPPRFASSRLVVLLVINLIWVILLWVGVIGKAFNDDSYDYVRHYTNWMWTIGAIYYTFDLIGLLSETRMMECILLLVPWWVFFANVNNVFWLTFIMVYDNPGTLTDNFEENGGDLYPGLVFLGDRLFHIVPVFMAYLNLFIRAPDFIDVYKSLFGNNTQKIYDNKNAKQLILNELEIASKSEMIADGQDFVRYGDQRKLDDFFAFEQERKSRIRKKWSEDSGDLQNYTMAPRVKERPNWYGCVPDRSLIQYSIVIYIILTFLSSFSIFFTYYNCFDFNEVYEVDTPVYVGVLAVIGSCALSTIPWLIVLSPIGQKARQRFLSSWTIKADEPSLNDRFIFSLSNQ